MRFVAAVRGQPGTSCIQVVLTLLLAVRYLFSLAPSSPQHRERRGTRCLSAKVLSTMPSSLRLADERVGLRHGALILGCASRQVNEEDLVL
jgi:hypothetical protein